MTRALMQLPGVDDVRIDLGKGEATVSHGGVSAQAMAAAVDDAGYEVTGTA